jgi:hypothetical protein
MRCRFRYLRIAFFALRRTIDDGGACVASDAGARIRLQNFWASCAKRLQLQVFCCCTAVVSVRLAITWISNVRDAMKARDLRTHKSSDLHWTLQYFTASQSVQSVGACLVIEWVHLVHLSGSLTSAMLMSCGLVDGRETQAD